MAKIEFMRKGTLVLLGLFENCLFTRKSSLVEKDFGGDYGKLNHLLQRADKYQRSNRGSIALAAF